MSQDQYRKIYLKSIHNSGLEFAEKPLQETAAAALRLRKGYIIPTGISPEDAVRTNDKWTYVLFLTVLADSINYLDSLEDSKKWVKSIIPKDYLNWIDNDTAEILIRSCCGIDVGPKYPILQIVSLAKNRTIYANINIDQNDFIQWLVDAVVEGIIKVNTTSSRAHFVAEGLLIKNSVLDMYIVNRGLNIHSQTLINLLVENKYYKGKKEYRVTNIETKSNVDGILFNDSIFAGEKRDINVNLALIK